MPISRTLVAEGARILVNLSHDGYFGGDAGARQHLVAAVSRAAELRRPVLRSTSDGITAAIDARGRRVAMLPSREPGVLVVDVWPGGDAAPALIWARRIEAALAGSACLAWAGSIARRLSGQR